MPAATNILKATTTSDAAPAAQAAPGGDVFAAMMSGTEAVAETATTGEETTVAEISGEPQPNLDILAPLLAQQQVVPTVTVPTVGTETVSAEGDAAATAIAGTVATSPLVPSEVEGRLNGISNPNPTPAASVAAATLDQALADARQLRSGRVEGVELPLAAEPTETAAGEAKLALADVAKALGKAGAQANQPATAPTIVTAQSATSDQQASGGQPQPDISQTIEVQTQQPTTNSVTDVRSLIASLTSATGLAGASGTAQGGAAQQLGQALAAQVLDLAGGSQWLDQLTDEIGRAADGSGPLRFRLTPESLGELKVEITQGDRGAIVRMTVATEAAQAALADAQPRLAAEARAQGVKIAETQVDLAGNQTQQHQQGRESARQQAATGDQPLRAFRGASAGTSTQAGTASSRSAERYA